eukprot:CAMPEP_0179435998 /NCGR_PEP_ID=MMETSP0799-20121207/20017_1 /TAXON_ID=46947 /ORGANISM="Geminigera cryophila, Strain CCMP2564" /LENGTH=337 /DNA_ID=CAMNT_0021215747 /DNA_START=95 /DNA_END=1108 /DNA_ORIENTATION=+
MPVVVIQPAGRNWKSEEAARGLVKIPGLVHLHIPATLPGTQLVQLLSCAAQLGWKGPVLLKQDVSTVRQDPDKIGVEGAQKLTSFFSRCTHLRHLALSGHSIRDEGATALIPALLQNSPLLESLDLRDNYLSDAAATSLAKALPRGISLSLLDMSDNNICQEGARELSTSIHLCTSLTDLRMGGNNISAKGAGCLVEALSKGTALRQLDLRGNNIWDEGVQSLTPYLPLFRNLQSLNLRGNKVGVWGAASIAQVLPKCLHLQRLDLGGNWLGDDGAIKIADCVALCGSLEYVGLTHNNIRIEGHDAVRLASAKLCSKVTLDLSWNPATMHNTAKGTL